jgi:crotonobetainyl-CoA:carnitine CoA-transferase CaiB-like acyl-CoA transferase
MDAPQPRVAEHVGHPPREEAMTLPLDGISIIDLTRARAGPTAVRQLADMGAAVIKVETRDDPDQTFARHGFDFQNLHRNKRSLTLDLKKPEGVVILKKLVAKADVLVENYRPDVKRRLGIDYETLSAINPRLIYGSISGFGQTGPYRDRPGYDQIAQGTGGLMSITGLPGQGPVRVGIPVADLTAGIFLAQGILVALFERTKSGKGQWVHTSLLEAMVTMLDFQAARWLIGKEIPPQAGNDHPTGIPTGVFKTADGHINIAASGQQMFRRLCEALGLEPLIDDPRFKAPPDRSKNRHELTRELEKGTSTRTSAQLVDALNKAGVPSGPILNVKEVFENEQVQHLGLAVPVTSPTLGDLRVQRVPVTLSRTPGSVRMPTPEAGEHNEEILRDLGYGPEDIARLRREEVV